MPEKITNAQVCEEIANSKILYSGEHFTDRRNATRYFFADKATEGQSIQALVADDDAWIISVSYLPRKESTPEMMKQFGPFSKAAVGPAMEIYASLCRQMGENAEVEA